MLDEKMKNFVLNGVNLMGIMGVNVGIMDVIVLFVVVEGL